MRTEWLTDLPEDETPWLSPDEELASYKPLVDSGPTYADPVRRDAVLGAFKVRLFELIS